MPIQGTCKMITIHTRVCGGQYTFQYHVFVVGIYIHVFECHIIFMLPLWKVYKSYLLFHYFSYFLFHYSRMVMKCVQES